jgi:hypothetical protein
MSNDKTNQTHRLTGGQGRRGLVVWFPLLLLFICMTRKHSWCLLRCFDIICKSSILDIYALDRNSITLYSMSPDLSLTKNIFIKSDNFIVRNFESSRMQRPDFFLQAGSTAESFSPNGPSTSLIGSLHSRDFPTMLLLMLNLSKGKYHMAQRTTGTPQPNKKAVYTFIILYYWQYSSIV